MNLIKNPNITTNKVAYNGVIPNTPLRFLWYLGSKFKFLGIISFVFVVIAETLGTLTFLVSAQLVDNFIAAGTLLAQKEALLFWGGLFLLVSAGNSLFYRLSAFSAFRWVIKFHKVGYEELYNYITTHSHTYFSNRFAGALSNKISNAVDSSAGLTFQILWNFFSEFIGLVVTMVLFFTIDYRIGLGLLSVFVLVLIFNIVAVRKRRPLVVEYANATSLSRGEGVDTITNIATVRQFSQRAFELKRLGNVFSERARKDLRQSMFGEWIMVGNTIFALLVTGVVLAVLYVLLSQGAITAGVLVLVLGLLWRVGNMFITLAHTMNRYIKDYGNIDEGLQEILVPHEIVDHRDAKKLEAEKGEIIWDNVNFAYEEMGVFKDFSLTIKPGQRIGLVGHSGSGKTTFVSLLLRQHDIEGGAIKIDGQDISKVKQDSLRENITIVPQEPMLFHRSIKENILYGKPDASGAEIIEAAKKAQAHDFIVKLPKGYETLVGERGVKLSGGQKQRVAIARAMLKEAPILLLDEATSALDSESEVLIQEALESLMEDKTVIAIAHRLSTLRKMDRIILLEDGQITEDGSHDELANAGGAYQQLWEHQVGGFIAD